MDCYSFGLGLMLVSFKVKLFEGNDGLFEECLDVDFGELVIGCVSFVDFGNLLCLIFSFF